MTQTPLNAPALHTRARPTDPETSHAAARSIHGGLTDIQRRVLEFYRARGWPGATDEELSDALGCHGSTLRTRRSELTDAGLIVDSGERRKLKSGRRGVVWLHAEFASPEQAPAYWKGLREA